MRKSLLHRYAPSLAPTLIPIKSQYIFIFSDHWGASLSARKGRIKLFCVETEVGPKKSPLKNKKLIFLWFFIGLSFMKKIITKNFDL